MKSPLRKMIYYYTCVMRRSIFFLQLFLANQRLSSLYWSLIPFTTIGVEGRLGWGIGLGRKNSSGDETNALEVGVAPLLGFVFPIGNRFQIFSDLLVEVAFSSNWYYHGLITEWINPGFDAGVIFRIGNYNLTSKYRGILYDGKYTHVVAAGLGYNFW